MDDVKVLAERIRGTDEREERHNEANVRNIEELRKAIGAANPSHAAPCPDLRLVQQQVAHQGAVLEREHEERRETEKTLFAKVDAIAGQAGGIWKALLFAVLPMLSAMVIAVIGFVLNYILKK